MAIIYNKVTTRDKREHWLSTLWLPVGHAFCENSAGRPDTSVPFFFQKTAQVKQGSADVGNLLLSDISPSFLGKAGANLSSTSLCCFILPLDPMYCGFLTQICRLESNSVCVTDSARGPTSIFCQLPLPDPVFWEDLIWGRKGCLCCLFHSVSLYLEIQLQGNILSLPKEH